MKSIGNISLSSAQTQESGNLELGSISGRSAAAQRMRRLGISFKKDSGSLHNTNDQSHTSGDAQDTGIDDLPLSTWYVCIPYRPQPQREAYFEFVKSFWKCVGYQVIVADSDPDQPFSLSEARNNCVRQILEDDALIIICDADTVLQDFAVLHDAGSFARAGRVVYPFHEYCYMPKSSLDTSQVRRTIDKVGSQTPLYVMPDSVGGCLIVSKKVYWNLGGMDEKFEKTWGYEDNAFKMVADTLASTVRLEGRLYSFQHDVDGGRVLREENPNWWRFQLYKHCYKKPQLMRELIK